MVAVEKLRPTSWPSREGTGAADDGHGGDENRDS
jgi:hypothetical protein